MGAAVSALSATAALPAVPAAAAMAVAAAVLNASRELHGIIGGYSVCFREIAL